jgi:hypothetical protein
MYHYRHLVELRGEGTRAWILAGQEVGRGPDNEPLLSASEVVAVDAALIDEATLLVDSMPANWAATQAVTLSRRARTTFSRSVPRRFLGGLVGDGCQHDGGGDGDLGSFTGDNA